MYVVNAGDLQVVTPDNSLMKYSDDTYLLIPACNVDSREKEISNVDVWSRANNLTLNQAKSVEVIFRDNRKRCCTHPPSPLQGRACDVAQSTWRHPYRQTDCHCARG